MNDSFGERLQSLREAAGLSQSELARESGTSIDSLRNWEQDRALPRIDAVTKIARALRVSLDRFAVEAVEKVARPTKKPHRRRPRKERS